MAAKKKTAKKPSKVKASTKPKAKKAARPAAKANKSKRFSAPKKATSKAKPSSKRGAAKKPRTAKRPALRPKPKSVKTPRAPRAAAPVNEEGLALARLVARAAEEKKALDVMILDVSRKGASVGYDFIVIATAESDRQLEALADSVREAVKPTGRRASGTETSPDWVLVNFDDVVVHFFTPDKRATYDIEGLWSDAPRLALSA